MVGKDRLRIVVRCRPKSSESSKADCTSSSSFKKSGFYSLAPHKQKKGELSQSIEATSDKLVIARDNNERNPERRERRFRFDHVFDGAAQQDIYEECGRDVVENVLEGFNSTVIAVGQTGSGKSFTMQGALNDSIEYGEREESRGLIQRIGRI